MIHLHRIDTHVCALIFKFAYGFAERALKFAHLRGDQLRIADENALAPRAVSTCERR